MTAKPLLTGAFHNPPIVVAQTVTMLEEHETSGITRAAVLANYRHGVVQTETEAGLVPKGGIIHLLIVAMSAIALQSATNHLPTVGTMTGAIRVADTTTLGDVLRQSPERHSPPRRIHDRGAIRNAPQRQNVHLEDSRTDGDADVPRQTGRTPAAPTLSQIAAAPRTQAILNNGIYDFESRRPNGDGRQSFNPALWRTTGGLDSHHSYEGSMAAGVVASHAPTSTAVRPGQQTEPDVYMRIAAEDAETERTNNGMSSIGASTSKRM
ncbi:hypothetical protein SNOG_08942 [Parastagonospora nodorum SN15]|uniref:Uncharacterized protein n=1 Tax=Phaeosphaeria nodorum (strain SN15 / ATCC MYA-4574 / FGSC 10173) TaxID=321614 RepID=Q0UH22_PHANO|nr:hypothetical protein SNOG_08942 [Parastagonospora nodorum SN15]EAT84110.1 hypothetical protein SNOG_08942 [Parastagonospora nodorum SN15]